MAKFQLQSGHHLLVAHTCIRPPFRPPIKRLWSPAVGQFWLSGHLAEGCRCRCRCLELKRLVVAHSTVSMPLSWPSFFVPLLAPSILCSFYACVSTCPNWPQFLWAATVRKHTHSHRGISISNPLRSPLVEPPPWNCILSGVLVSPCHCPGLLFTGVWNWLWLWPELCVMRPSNDRARGTVGTRKICATRLNN